MHRQKKQAPDYREPVHDKPVLAPEEDYFLKPLTLLEGVGWDVGLESLAQAPRPNATAIRVTKAMCFIGLGSIVWSAEMTEIHCLR
jgi:hypothetical protein